MKPASRSRQMISGAQMKNIQVIDSADNSKYNVYAATDIEFEEIFPNGADIEFIEDLVRRLGNRKAGEITNELWKRPIRKIDVNGIHGTLFYQLKKSKKKYYPNKRFDDDKYG
jgi:hypothetical protein